MNNTIKELYERKSIRVFEDREIGAEEKEAILKAAILAPSAGNMQMYTILDITDQDLKDKLAVSCDNQPFIAKGKMVLVFCADYHKWYQAFEYEGCEPREVGEGDMLLATTDTVIAAQNAVVAAESLGIGSCYIGDILEKYEYHKELLHLPDYVIPVAMLVFGYPTEQQEKRSKPQRPKLKYLVHENGYKDFSKEESEDMMKVHAGDKDYKNWLRMFYDRKYNSDFCEEMTRSVRAMISALHK